MFKFKIKNKEINCILIYANKRMGFLYKIKILQIKLNIYSLYNNYQVI